MESFRETSQAFWNYVNILQRKIHWVRSNISLHFNLHGIGSSSPLQIFLRFCCLIQEKRIVAYPSLVFLKKFLYICTFSAGFKSNNLSYCAPSSSVLFSVFIIVLPPYLQYIAFSLIPTPLSSVAIIFFIVKNPERNKNIWFTKLNKGPRFVRKFYCNLVLRQLFLLFNSSMFSI